MKTNVNHMKDMFLELSVQLERARESGQFMVAIWHIDGREVKFWRMTNNYPIADFNISIDQLKNDILAERTAPTGKITAEASQAM